MKIIINIVLFFGFFSGTYNRFVPIDLPASANKIEVEVIDTLTKSNAAKISVDHTLFYEGDTLILHFSTPNDPYLGVIDPDGHFFYIVFPDNGVLGDLKPYVDSKHFTNMRTMNIHTASFKADPYIYEVDKNQPVFTKSGDYTFIMGQNLHVDDPKMLDHLLVHYKRGFKPELMAGVCAEKL
jgi:hypothetical protein